MVEEKGQRKERRILLDVALAVGIVIAVVLVVLWSLVDWGFKEVVYAEHFQQFEEIAEVKRFDEIFDISGNRRVYVVELAGDENLRKKLGFSQRYEEADPLYKSHVRAMLSYAEKKGISVPEGDIEMIESYSRDVKKSALFGLWLSFKNSERVVGIFGTQL